MNSLSDDFLSQLLFISEKFVRKTFNIVHINN